MSWNVVIVDPNHKIETKVRSVSYSSSNLLEELRVHPQQHGYTTTTDNWVCHLDEALEMLRYNKEAYGEFSPINDWGSVDSVQDFLHLLRTMCTKYPECLVVWR